MNYYGLPIHRKKKRKIYGGPAEILMNFSGTIWLQCMSKTNISMGESLKEKNWYRLYSDQTIHYPIHSCMHVFGFSKWVIQLICTNW